ncbi:hypothetical protein EK21DRAFT_113341 [Setomelanomma holmii]|uniref:Uncharacterized protein n=1 Tax=Setomelanomma holmii TaxID=210430 RepID=A0A9P4H6B3_9PLEO|nr:hypothetical protein EK21DRAFT_113341 [Setomelanomma holmii]
MAVQPFSFLDLPAEIPLMVYERLPITTRHHTYSPESDHGGKIILVTKSIESSILALCRIVHTEIKPILTEKLGKLHAEPTRLIMDHRATQCRPFRENVLEGVKARIKQLHSCLGMPGELSNSLDIVKIEDSALTSFVNRFASSIWRGASLPSLTHKPHKLHICLTMEEPINSVEAMRISQILEYIGGRLRECISTLTVIIKPSPYKNRAVLPILTERAMEPNSAYQVAAWQDEEDRAEEWEEKEEF